MIIRVLVALLGMSVAAEAQWLSGNGSRDTGPAMSSQGYVAAPPYMYDRQDRLITEYDMDPWKRAGVAYPVEIATSLKVVYLDDPTFSMSFKVWGERKVGTTLPSGETITVSTFEESDCLIVVRVR